MHKNTKNIYNDWCEAFTISTPTETFSMGQTAG